jgi:hypothetical protein
MLARALRNVALVSAAQNLAALSKTRGEVGLRLTVTASARTTSTAHTYPGPGS